MSGTQNYISSELTHFIGRGLAHDNERYKLFIEIIKTGDLLGRNKNSRGAILSRISRSEDISTNEAYNPDMVCFCDIPANDFEIHMNKYGRFGISFDKKFMTSQGVRPVYYIPKNSVVTKKSISDIFNNGIKGVNGIINSSDLSIEQFLDFHVFSFIKFYDSGKADDDPDNYYMEREWRGLEAIKFKLSDITRIILPPSYVNKFIQDIPNYDSHLMTV